MCTKLQLVTASHQGSVMSSRGCLTCLTIHFSDLDSNDLSTPGMLFPCNFYSLLMKLNTTFVCNYSIKTLIEASTGPFINRFLKCNACNAPFSKSRKKYVPGSVLSLKFTQLFSTLKITYVLIYRVWKL